MALTTSPFEHDRPIWQTARLTLLGALLTLYVAVATLAAVVFPPFAAVFVAPFLIGVAATIPVGRALPRTLMRRAIYLGAFLLTIWPIYLHVKIGPLPILTPSRTVFYGVTALWLVDIGRSSMRRAQFALAVRRNPVLVGSVFAFFLLGALSLPLAEGRGIAIPEFIRQVIIYLLPFMATLTYIRTSGELSTLMKWVLAGAGVSALIALAEVASGTLMASLLAPLIADNAEWLRIAQELKIRDGVFRAQASHTHPLSLGEFLAMCAPFALAFALAARARRPRLLWLLLFGLTVVASIATNSRGALLSIVVSMGVMIALIAQRYYNRAAASRFRPAVGLASLALIAASPVAVVAAYGFVTGAGGESAAKSSQSRLDQIEMAWPKIKKRPVLGYGVGRAARVLGFWGQSLTIDNYYLTLALDLGLPGPIVFAMIYGSLGVAAARRARARPPRHRHLDMAFIASAVGLLVTRTVMSLTGNLALFFIILAAFAGAGVRREPSRRRPREKLSADDQLSPTAAPALGF